MANPHQFMSAPKPSQSESKSTKTSMVGLDFDGSLTDGNAHNQIMAGIGAFKAFIELDLQNYKENDEEMNFYREDRQEQPKAVIDAQITKALSIFPDAKIDANQKKEAVKKRWEFIVDLLEEKSPPRHNDDDVVKDIKAYLDNNPIMVDHDDVHIKGNKKAVEKAKDFHWKFLREIIKGNRKPIPPAEDKQLLPNNTVNTTTSLVGGRIPSNKEILNAAIDEHEVAILSRTGFPHIIRPYLKEIIGLDDEHLDKILILGDYVGGGQKDIMFLQAMLIKNFMGFLEVVNAAIEAKALEAKIENNQMEDWKKVNGYDLQKWIQNPWTDKPDIKNVNNLLKAIIKTDPTFKKIVEDYLLFFDDNADNNTTVHGTLGCKTIKANAGDKGKSLMELNASMGEMTKKNKVEAAARARSISPPGSSQASQ